MFLTHGTQESQIDRLNTVLEFNKWIGTLKRIEIYMIKGTTLFTLKRPRSSLILNGERGLLRVNRLSVDINLMLITGFHRWHPMMKREDPTPALLQGQRQCHHFVHQPWKHHNLRGQIRATGLYRITCTFCPWYEVDVIQLWIWTKSSSWHNTAKWNIRIIMMTQIQLCTNYDGADMCVHIIWG